MPSPMLATRPAGTPDRDQAVLPRLRPGPGEPGLQQWDEVPTVPDPGRVGRETRVGGKLRSADGRAEPRELRVVAHGHGQGRVGCGQELVGHDGGVVIAHPLGHDTGPQVRLALVGECALEA